MQATFPARLEAVKTSIQTALGGPYPSWETDTVRQRLIPLASLLPSARTVLAAGVAEWYLLNPFGLYLEVYHGDMRSCRERSARLGDLVLRLSERNMWFSIERPAPPIVIISKGVDAAEEQERRVVASRGRVPTTAAPTAAAPTASASAAVHDAPPPVALELEEADSVLPPALFRCETLFEHLRRLETGAGGANEEEDEDAPPSLPPPPPPPLTEAEMERSPLADVWLATRDATSATTGMKRPDAPEPEERLSPASPTPPPPPQPHQSTGGASEEKSSKVRSTLLPSFLKNSKFFALFVRLCLYSIFIVL